MSLEITSLDNLFVSKVRIKSLEFFLLNPNRSIHLRGAVRELKEEINAVRRELMRLEKSKIVIAETKGNRKYFKTNMEHPFIDELLKMFHKSYGLGAEIIVNRKKLGEVEFALLTSAYTRGIQHGDQIIDLFIVGLVDMPNLEQIINEFETKSGREIRYTVLKPSEYATRRRRNDNFILDVMVQDVTMLVGTYHQFIKGKSN